MEGTDLKVEVGMRKSEENGLRYKDPYSSAFGSGCGRPLRTENIDRGFWIDEANNIGTEIIQTVSCLHGTDRQSLK